MDTEAVFVGVDPGITFGLAVVKAQVDGTFDVQTGESRCSGGGNWADDYRNGVQNALIWIMEKVISDFPVIIGIEDFVLYGLGGTTEREGLSPALLGFALYSDLCRAGLGASVRWNMAAMAKSTFKDAWLRKHGYWKGLSAHERDAVRHAFLVRRMG